MDPLGGTASQANLHTGTANARVEQENFGAEMVIESAGLKPAELRSDHSDEIVRDNWRAAPRVWRFLLRLARWVIPLVCKLQVTGDIPAELRNKPVILAGNHIGLFDPIALTAACGKRRFAPRFLATMGLLNAPGFGHILAACGHIGVDRQRRGGDSLQKAEQALAARSAIALYPEGRITLDPGLWPERGKTGVIRLAQITGAAIVPVVQWGAHQMVAYHGIRASLWRVIRGAWRRPVVKVHFGQAFYIDELGFDLPRESSRAADHIMMRIKTDLDWLRANEPGLADDIDITRPATTQRSLHNAPSLRNN